MRRVLIIFTLGVLGLAGCGSGDDDSAVRGPSPAPTIETAVREGEEVTVAYTIPDSGGNDPVQMLLSLDDTDNASGPLTETVYPIEQEGEVTMEFEADSSHDTVLASVYFEDGSRSEVVRHPVEVGSTD